LVSISKIKLNIDNYEDIFVTYTLKLIGESDDLIEQ